MLDIYVPASQFSSLAAPAVSCGHSRPISRPSPLPLVNGAHCSLPQILLSSTEVTGAFTTLSCRLCRWICPARDGHMVNDFLLPKA